jgi:uncharacterized RDD family membrane protein YckC
MHTPWNKWSKIAPFLADSCRPRMGMGFSTLYPLPSCSQLELIIKNIFKSTMQDDILDNEAREEPVNLETVRFAGFGIRVGASIIDSLVLIPLMGINYYNIIDLKNLMLAILLALLSAAYKPLMEYYYGATVGKMAVKIKVVDYQLRAISLEQALIRYSPWVLSVAINLLATIYIFQLEDFAEIQDFLSYGELANATPYQKWIQFSIWIAPISAFGMLFNPFQQAVHDQLAKTYCVYANQ